MHSNGEALRAVSFRCSLLAPGCEPLVEPPDPPPAASFPDGWEDGGEVVCAAPYVGLDRLVESGAERGLTVATFNLHFGPIFVLTHDIDADGDVDILHFNGTERLVPFMNDGLGFFTPGQPIDPPPFGPSFLAIGLADDDGDGLPDLYLASTPHLWRYANRGGGLFDPPTSLWEEPMPDQHRYPALSIADADGDGDLDVAMFEHQLDTGPPGDDDDSGPMEFEGTRDVMLRFDGTELVEAIDLVDLENDGWLDIVQASGPLPDGPGAAQAWPDIYWQGQPDGTFEDVTTETGFGSLAENYGLATADFDGDGFLDVVRVAPGVPPSLLLNRCGAGSWLDFELIGLPANREAFGARIEVTSGEVTHLREMHSARGQAQSPSRLHFGLGDVDTVGPVRIVWPDGTVSEAARVPVNRRVFVTHPWL